MDKKVELVDSEEEMTDVSIELINSEEELITELQKEYNVKTFSLGNQLRDSLHLTIGILYSQIHMDRQTTHLLKHKYPH